MAQINKNKCMSDQYLEAIIEPTVTYSTWGISILINQHQGVILRKSYFKADFKSLNNFNLT